jgi:anti-anti-sigma factor
VNFLASIGIRMLTLTAKSVSVRGGKMVMASPAPDVHQVLDVTGIPVIIPVFPDLQSAQAAF